MLKIVKCILKFIKLKKFKKSEIHSISIFPNIEVVVCHVDTDC